MMMIHFTRKTIDSNTLKADIISLLRFTSAQL